MTTTALSASEPDTQSDPRPAPVGKKRVAATEPRSTRSRRPRTKKAPLVAHTALLEQPLEVPPRAKTQVGTLLVGAGIGAAVTLSVVAFGTKRGRGSVFALAVTKSISYAIARTTERGTLINLVAQAVGSAIA